MLLQPYSSLGKRAGFSGICGSVGGMAGGAG